MWTHFLIELIVEVIAAAIIGSFFWYNGRRQMKALEKRKAQIVTNRLNDERIDEVFLIDSLDDMSELDQIKFNRASIVLMKSPHANLYNIVIRNRYGSEGEIK